MPAKKYSTYNTTNKRTELASAVTVSTGGANDGDLVALNASGILDDSIINATVSSSANKIVKLDGTGKLDTSVMPVGIGADVITANAGEALSAGNYVYINASGAIMKADGASGKAAVGFVLAAVSNGNPATVYCEGTNTQLSALTAGTRYFLGASGAPTASPDSTTTGAVIQYIGTAHSTTAINFQTESLTWVG